MPESYCRVGSGTVGQVTPGTTRQHPYVACVPVGAPDGYGHLMASTPWLDREHIRFMLEECETWAVVGLSGNPHRTAYRIARFLQEQRQAHRADPPRRARPCSASRATPRSPTCRSRSTSSTCSAAPRPPASSPTRPSRSAPRASGSSSACVDEDAFERTAAAGVPMVMDTCPAIEWPRTEWARDALPPHPPRRHRRDAARPPGRRPLPLARGPGLRGDPRLGASRRTGAARAHLDALRLAAVVPPHDDRSIVGRPRAGTPDKVGGRYVVSRNDGTQQQDLWFVGGHPRRAPAAAAGCCSTPTRSPRTAPPRWPATTPARTAAGWPTWSATAAATGARSGCSTWPAATRSTTCVTKVKFSEATWLPDHCSYLYLHFPDRGRRRSAPRRPRCPAASCGGTTSASPRTPTSWCWSSPRTRASASTPTLSHDGRWLAVAPARGHLGEEPAVGLPGATTDGGASRSASR